ncbi:type I restriction-modification system endonuclease [Salinibacterium sp. SWN167]|uniref:type I restriction-modification system endonuclease n=1 Tax=Salinibacterium sp. SWN167 TaxID=2792054 RepID=UPI0018CF5202|nr:type I restriction-modification system endonuclease [Salinibacterium sp. SWN167]MBH0083004.1 type I restriction-modification system endonuclease [Salinibacterium sp. SWN167]
MGSNFDYLEDAFPSLANLGRLAEAYRQSDPNSSLLKQGMIGESIVSMMFKFDSVTKPYDDRAITRIDSLQSEGLLPKDVLDILHLLRKARNRAAHDGWGDEETATQFLSPIHSVTGWFATTYGPVDLTIPTFVLQTSDTVAENTQSLEQDQLTLIEADEKKAETAPAVTKSVRRDRADKAANQRPHTEAETRLLIDEQLRQVGWEADSQVLRYSKGARPEASRNLAIAEWPTNSALPNGGTRGFADYALFVGKKLVAVVEAKASHKDVPSVLDYQAKDYAQTIRSDHHDLTLGTWGVYRAPFIFATNGRPYLDQYKTKSGVWFRDVRSADNIPRALQGWHSPGGLIELFESDPDKADNALASLSDDLLTNPNGLNLRSYQIDAIHAAEDAVTGGKTHALLAMATGTGKTRTVLGMIYRFLKTDRFRRVLFLVDRTSLGDQAEDTFKDVKLEELMTLNELYTIQGLEDTEIDPDLRVQVSTVQGMVKRLFRPEGDTKPAVSDFDLIIIDEAHRGYLLDKEMTDDEVQYRDQFDYQSAYRSAIDYFDAAKIAITATPALHTTQIFGQPVYTYTYREAVIDGWLVDHDAPHRLTTRLSSDGIKFAKGETIPIYDPETGEIANSAELEDEVTFEVDQFNRKVITEDFNRAVLAEIAQGIDPTSPEEYGKTLIYAVDDAHADMIVNLLKGIYAESGVDTDAIMKITGSVAGGNKKKIKEAIKRFKNERFPSIVVTVDLLTTGIDIPELTSLVFLRRVRSRILFEQMLGRATRLCPEIGKEKFDIYDPVGVYEALDLVSTMKPLAANPNTSFADLLEGINFTEEVPDSEGDSLAGVITQIIAKLQRRAHRVKGQAAEHANDLAGGKGLKGVAETLKNLSSEDAAEWVKDHVHLFAYLDDNTFDGPRSLVISDKSDELLTHTRDYGDTKRPEDYLDEFTTYLKTNRDEIAALTIICTKPSDLTREQLKSLKLVLDRAGFTQQRLSSAVSEMTNTDITADIISLIRRYTIGSPLLSHEERVELAVQKIESKYEFNRMEQNWLRRIQDFLANEELISQDTFDEDVRFRNKGGFAQIDKAFRGRLSSVINDINTYMYEEAA